MTTDLSIYFIQKGSFVFKDNQVLINYGGKLVTVECLFSDLYEIRNKTVAKCSVNDCCGRQNSIYRVIQKESARLREMMVSVILSKKVHTNMCPILDGNGVDGIF